MPGPGAYTAELQTDSLPKGVNLTDAKRTKLSFSVNPSQRKPLIFPFGKDTRVTVSTLDKIPGTHPKTEAAPDGAASDPVSGWPRSSIGQDQLHHGDVEPRAELPPDLPFVAHDLEAERGVEAD
ncbi:MAG: hypothetical protein V9G12_23375 [Microthrixaceae bacterium]